MNTKLCQFEVVGKNVTVKNAAGHVRRYDYVVEIYQGAYKGIEVKSGSAQLTKTQRLFEEGVSDACPATAVGLNGSEVKGPITQTGAIRMP